VASVPSELEAGDIQLPPPQRPEQPIQRAAEPFVRPTLEAIRDAILGPGRAMRQEQPQAGQMWSDEQEAIRQANAAGALGWGAQTAMGMVGTPALTGGVPAGALGSGAQRVPDVLYHVVPRNFNLASGLASLYSRYGAGAYARFQKRWPDAGGMEQYHAHRIMFYDNPAAAIEHAENLGGKVLTVDPAKVPGDFKFDTLEAPGYWTTTDKVPPEAIKKYSPSAAQPASPLTKGTD
jgi:hypothetical protein